MKKIIFAALALFTIGIATASADKNRIIAKENLPQKSQQFITTHFGDMKISYVKEERDFLEKSFEVVFADGTKVEFARNGEWKDVAATELSPSSGTICVCTSLGDDGKWTEAEVKISTPGQYAFPIGSCKVDGESVTFCAFRVPVAIFIVSDVCSTTN